MPRLLWILSWLVVPVLAGPSVSQAQPRMKEYRDNDYNFAFRYPADWKIRQLPEGAANRDIRVIAQAAHGGSFMVVVEKVQNPAERGDSEARGDRTEAIAKLARQTVGEIYQTISKNIQATGMKVGEIRDVSSDVAIKYYVSTLHEMKSGPPVIVAGIHALPYGKPYRVDFLMTAPWNRAAKKENEVMMMAFNSFHLVGETASGGAVAPEPPGSGAEK
jgi:hypothetical protein